MSFDSSRRPVADLIMGGLPPSSCPCSIILTMGHWDSRGDTHVVSVLALDYAVTFFAFVGISIPSFFFGLLLLYVFALKLDVLPAGGFFMAGEARTFLGYVKYLLLPSITLGLSDIAGIARYMRSSLLEVLGHDFLRTARARAWGEYRGV